MNLELDINSSCLMPKKLKNQNRRNSLNMFEFLGYFDDKKNTT